MKDDDICFYVPIGLQFTMRYERMNYVKHKMFA